MEVVLYASSSVCLMRRCLGRNAVLGKKCRVSSCRETVYCREFGQPERSKVLSFPRFNDDELLQWVEIILRQILQCVAAGATSILQPLAATSSGVPCIKRICLHRARTAAQLTAFATQRLMPSHQGGPFSCGINRCKLVSPQSRSRPRNLV